jgi:hypothetical protein
MSLLGNAYSNINIEEVYTTPTEKINGKIIIAVKSSIYEPIKDSIQQYIKGLEAEDYSVIIAKISGGEPQELKDYLKSKLSSGLIGCLLIGDLPIPYFEIDNDFGDYGYTSFPIDLFYMDLDGEWIDKDKDGKYDDHKDGEGDKAPEIWVGRLITSLLSHPEMDEVDLLKNYFLKNHSYKKGEYKDKINQRALAYVDDDWYYFGTCYLDRAYENATAITDKNTTIASDYKNRLTENYEWIQLCAHSNPTLHSFKTSESWNGGSVSYSDIRDIDPVVHFYNLFACSNCRYDRSNYMGGHYTFALTYGLASVGSTKTGSMLGFNYFYGPLGEGKTLGEAFRDWFTLVGLGNRSWYYGMTLLGDPTLKISKFMNYLSQIGYSPMEFEFKATEGSSNCPSQLLSISNIGGGTLDWTVSTDATWLVLNPTSGSTLSGGTSRVTVSADITELSVGNYNATITITDSDAINSPQTIPVTLVIHPLSLPDLTITSIKIYDDKGEEVSQPIVNKTYTLKATVKNIGEGPLNKSYQVRFSDKGDPRDTIQVYIGSNLESDQEKEIIYSYTFKEAKTYSLLFLVDDIPDDNSESNEKNNYLIRDVNVISSLPDLVITRIWWQPSNPTTQDIVTIYATVKNIGKESANAHITCWTYINGYHAANTFYGRVLNPGQERTERLLSSRFGDNVWFKIGVNRIEVKVDPDNWIKELNEDNNHMEGAFTILANQPPIAYAWIWPRRTYQGRRVYFYGYGRDRDGRIVAYEWKSSIDGLLSTRRYFSTKRLSLGRHIISFRVRDNQGTWSKEVTKVLMVKERPNRRPFAYAWIWPRRTYQGRRVYFYGYGRDRDGYITEYSWRSSIDGFLSSKRSFSMANLSIGTHIIYFKVRDNQGTWSKEVKRRVVIREKRIRKYRGYRWFWRRR